MRLALRANDDIGGLVGRLGTAEHPRGAVLVAYRNARRAMASALGDAGPFVAPSYAVREVMGALRRDVEQAMGAVALASVELGLGLAGEQLAGYGAPGRGRVREWDSGGAVLAQERAQAVAAVTSVVDGQLQAALALVMSGAAPEMVLGGGTGSGVLLPGPVLSQGALWIGTLVAGAWRWLVRPSQPPDVGGRTQRWFHQAVAAIDERTTDCCLRVHGQVQPLDEDFELTGTPRYADHLPHPPFHWYCRSAEALVRPEDVGDDLTQEMVDAARAELRAREATGRRVEIHPADARSRR